MRMKSIITLLVAMVFTLGMVSLTFAAEVKGTVTKVSGMTVTVKEATGKEVSVKVSNVKDVKVGDMVTVKDGKATKEAAPAAAPAKKSSSGGY